ncbi:MAG TPA: hypothetical protein VF099_11765 [Ktedonobacterales bacterium]
MTLLMISPPLPQPRWRAGARSYHLLKTLARAHPVPVLTVTDSTGTEATEDLALLREFTHALTLILRQPSQAKRWQQLMSVFI